MNTALPYERAWSLSVMRRVMQVADEILKSTQAARRLGISATTLYDWLGQSDRGLLRIHGQPVTIDYYQSGSKGQGKIQISTTEVDRIRDLMRVRPQRVVLRRPPVRQNSFPGIIVKLGRPDQ